MFTRPTSRDAAIRGPLLRWLHSPYTQRGIERQESVSFLSRWGKQRRCRDRLDRPAGAAPVASGNGAASLGLAHAAAHPNRPMARLVVAYRWLATDVGGLPAVAPVATSAEGSNRGGGAARKHAQT
jgi:hypothetical protein